MTVRELLSRIDSRELSEWMADYRLQPWGELREDLRMGVLAALIYNAWKDGKSPAKAPEDFVLDFDGIASKVEQDEDEMKAILQRFSAVKNNGNR